MDNIVHPQVLSNLVCSIYPDLKAGGVCNGLSWVGARAGLEKPNTLDDLQRKIEQCECTLHYMNCYNKLEDSKDARLSQSDVDSFYRHLDNDSLQQAIWLQSQQTWYERLWRWVFGLPAKMPENDSSKFFGATDFKVLFETIAVDQSPELIASASSSYRNQASDRTVFESMHGTDTQIPVVLPGFVEAFDFKGQQLQPLLHQFKHIADSLPLSQLSIIVSTPCHAMSLSYHSDTGLWDFVDSNSLPLKRHLTLEQTILELRASLTSLRQTASQSVILNFTPLCFVQNSTEQKQAIGEFEQLITKVLPELFPREAGQTMPWDGTEEQHNLLSSLFTLLQWSNFENGLTYILNKYPELFELSKPSKKLIGAKLLYAIAGTTQQNPDWYQSQYPQKSWFIIIVNFIKSWILTCVGISEKISKKSQAIKHDTSEPKKTIDLAPSTVDLTYSQPVTKSKATQCPSPPITTKTGCKRRSSTV